MAKMADLKVDPTAEENEAEEAPVGEQYRSSANVHAEDMKKMGMESMAHGDHVEGPVHGIVSHSHEGGITMHITHGALKKAGGKSMAEKMYGKPAPGADGEGGY